MHEVFDLTCHFEGTAIGRWLQPVHRPDVYGLFPFQPANQLLPRFFFVLPVVSVGRLLGGLRGAAVGIGLEELVRGIQNSFGRRFRNDATGRAEVRGDFDQVAGDDGDARLEIVKEFVG